MFPNFRGESECQYWFLSRAWHVPNFWVSYNASIDFCQELFIKEKNVNTWHFYFCQHLTCQGTFYVNTWHVNCWHVKNFSLIHSSTKTRAPTSHYRSFWSHIIPLRLDLWQCVIRTLVCEEHKQNNSQLIPGPWRLEKGRGPRHSHIAEKQRSQELGSLTIALYLTPTQL